MSDEVGLRGEAIVSVLGFLNGRNEGGIQKMVQGCVGEGKMKRGQTVLVGSHIEKSLS